MVFHGLGLAIPSNEARAFAANDASRARLGVEMIRVREGLIVIAVERGSPAEGARVLIGDVLLCTPEQLRARLEEATVNGSTDIPILRSGRNRTLRVHFSRSAEAKAA
jgi:S1-C subfamily serine protease